MPSKKPKKKPATKTSKGITSHFRQPMVSGIPLYLVVMLVVLALLGGYALNILLNPQEPTTFYPQPKELEPIQAILLYSTECKLCEKYNSFELVLKSRNIPYYLNAVEATSQEGKSLTEKYNIQQLPALVIDPLTVSREMTIITSSGQDVSLKALLEQNRVKDKYVVLESDLDKKFHTKFYTSKPEQCIDNPEKIDILIFDDFYCPDCIKHWAIVRAIHNDFNNSVELHYAYLPTASSQLVERYGSSTAEAVVKTLLCAEQKGKLFEMNDQLKGIYCDKHKDYVSNDIELNACHIANPRYGKPLEQKYVTLSINKLHMDLNEMNTCIDNLSESLESNIQNSKFYSVREPPAAVVDCKYLVEIENLRDVVCSTNPSLEGCSKENPEIISDSEIKEEGIQPVNN